MFELLVSLSFSSPEFAICKAEAGDAVPMPTRLFALSIFSVSPSKARSALSAQSLALVIAYSYTLCASIAFLYAVLTAVVQTAVAIPCTSVDSDDVS